MCKVLFPIPSFDHTSTILVYHALANSYHTFAGNCRANNAHRTVSTHMTYAPERMYIATMVRVAHDVDCPICTINRKYFEVMRNNSAIQNAIAGGGFY